MTAVILSPEAGVLLAVLVLVLIVLILVREHLRQRPALRGEGSARVESVVHLLIPTVIGLLALRLFVILL